ncbi:NACHT domain-containing protein [Amycolatopsis keratiniphila]|uniref:AAA+ ATPase domain-containing protein n=1 Tax=Amycolatopsis keratiniphila TaxID=129921 RepID=R4STS1_9PSEU|nr:AAA family ATPase [Amycolatopsis keratiniphila]AGM05930.1 hypothetical protein AORI_3345 [Amycolatopsis keratiniphila]
MEDLPFWRHPRTGACAPVNTPEMLPSMVVARNISYRDSLRILSGKDSQLVNEIDKILGGIILTSALAVGPGVLPAIGVKNQLRQLMESPLGKLGAKLKNSYIPELVDRIAAANALTVVLSVIEVTSEVVGGEWDNLLVTDDEIRRLLGLDGQETDPTLSAIVEHLSRTELPAPESVLPFSDTVEGVRSFAREYAKRLVAFLHGLQLRENLGASQKVDLDRRILATLPDRAGEKYEEYVCRLASDVPEFAMWLDLRQHEATRGDLAEKIGILKEKVDTQFGMTSSLLDQLGSLLSSGLVENKSSHRWIEGLRACYSAELTRTILETSDGSEVGLNIPTMREAYIDPLFKLAVDEDGPSMLSSEQWWRDREEQSDILRVMAGYLTSPRSMEVPLLLLGHPGAGKSTVARVLAAELAASDFLPIHVVLRKVSANASIQAQIEEALFLVLQERISWPALLASSPGLHPVLILDGFDELVQATGTSQSQYLEQVREFQWNSNVQGRSISVIVTSRTIVADRARVPRGTVALKLEPFNTAQITAWVDKWNIQNAQEFARLSIEPLDVETVIRYRDLSQHPILLLMLALYDSDGNPLTREKESLVGAALYERLFIRFARREIVNRQGANMEDRDIEKKIEEELYYLAIAALAMFNRGAQIINEDELELDLSALMGTVETSTVHDFQSRISRAHALVGSFYFVNKSEAAELRRDGEKGRNFNRSVTSRSFEFLHATFGEYLVARLFKNLLQNCRKIVSGDQPWEGSREVIQDDLIKALYSHEVLAQRQQILLFLAEMPTTVDERGSLVKTLGQLLERSGWDHVNHGYERYGPRSAGNVKRMAVYSVNLILSYAAFAKSINVKELFFGPARDESGHSSASQRWKQYALLWESQLEPDRWRSICSVLRLSLDGDGDGLVYQFSLGKDFEISKCINMRDSLHGGDYSSANYLWINDLMEQEIRRVELSPGLLNLPALAPSVHLFDNVGQSASTIFTAGSSFALDSIINNTPGNVALGSLFLTRIAYPQLDEKGKELLAHDYLVLLRTVGRTKSGGELPGETMRPRNSSAQRLARYVLHTLHANYSMLPSAVKYSILKATLSLGPSDADLEFYSSIIELTGKIANADGFSKELVGIARNAFAQLDASHLIETQPAVMLSMILNFETSGMPVSRIAEYGRLEDVFDLFDLVEIGRYVDPMIISRVFRLARSRMLVRWTARKTVEILPLLDDSSLSKLSATDWQFLVSCVKVFAADVAPRLYERFSEWLENLAPSSDGVTALEFDTTEEVRFARLASGTDWPR